MGVDGKKWRSTPSEEDAAEPEVRNVEQEILIENKYENMLEYGRGLFENVYSTCKKATEKCF